MQVQYGKTEDIAEWMKLVEEIRWNYPGLETKEALEEHRETVLRFMNKGQALCVKEGVEIKGVCLFSRGHNMICCLGVSPKYRRRGIASMLLSAALVKLDRTKDISVSTFREEDEKGTAPRALYKKFGFAEDELIEEFGYPNQKFILHSIIGERVTVKVDRPMGSYHPKHTDMYYPINYGYVEGVMAPDGEEQDAYILGVEEPVEEFTGVIVAIIHRHDDVEEKWVVAPENGIFSAEEIETQVHFQEQYFDMEIRM